MRKSLLVKQGKTDVSNLHIKGSTVVISLFIHQIPVLFWGVMSSSFGSSLYTTSSNLNQSTFLDSIAAPYSRHQQTQLKFESQFKAAAVTILRFASREKPSPCVVNHDMVTPFDA